MARFYPSRNVPVLDTQVLFTKLSSIVADMLSLKYGIISLVSTCITAKTSELKSYLVEIAFPPESLNVPWSLAPVMIVACPLLRLLC